MGVNQVVGLGKKVNPVKVIVLDEWIVDRKKNITYEDWDGEIVTKEINYSVITKVRVNEKEYETEIEFFEFYDLKRKMCIDSDITTEPKAIFELICGDEFVNELMKYVVTKR